MKIFLKNNWFKVSIIVLIAAGITTTAFVILKIKKEDNDFAQQKYMDQQAQTPKQIQVTSTPNGYVDPFTKSSSSDEGTSSNLSTIEPPEDSVLKIARCQSDAQIESNLEISRYNDPTDLMACLNNPQCNFSSLSPILKDQANSIGQSSYDSVYNLCLQISKSVFDNFEQTYDNYWNECISQNPEPTTDSSGATGMQLYNTRHDCVTNLEKANSD